VIATADDEDAKTLSEHRWYAVPNVMGGFYAAAKVINAAGRSTTLYMHRLLMDAPKGLQVDHINHDTLDNRRANLRIVTNQVNNANRAGPYSSNKHGVRGLSIHHRERYVVRCAIVTCPVARYFPFSSEGLAEATAFSVAHFAGAPLPVRPRRANNGAIGESGVAGVLVERKVSRPNYIAYVAKCQRAACRVRKNFPYTAQGLEAARQFLEEHDRHNQ